MFLRNGRLIKNKMVFVIKLEQKCIASDILKYHRRIFSKCIWSNFVASITIKILLSEQVENNLFVLVSIANPDGPSPGAKGQRAMTLKIFKSTTAISLLSSRFTNNFSFLSDTDSSGLPSNATESTNVFVPGSIIERFLPCPLLVIIFLVNGSYIIASGLAPVGICVITAFVFRSNTLTLFSRPLFV